jgi:hypothetical protein
VSSTGVPIYVRPVSGRGKPGGIVEPLALIVLLLIWMASSSGTGLLLALLAKRLHPGLSMVKLWLFYTVLMAMLVAVVFLIAWF